MNKADLYRERQLEESIPHLEARRRHYRRHVVFWLVAEGLLSALAIALIAIGALQGEPAFFAPSISAFVLITPLFVLAAHLAGHRYHRFFAQDVATLFATGFYDRYEADVSRDLGDEPRNMIGAPHKRLRPAFASFYKGCYHGVKFKTFAFKSGKGKEGRYFVFELNAPLEGDVLLKGRGGLPFFAGVNLPLAIPTPDDEFLKTHSLTGSDPEKGLRSFGPLVSKGLASLETSCGGLFSLYYHERKAIVYLDGYQSAYKPSVNREVTMEVLEAYGREVTLAGRLSRTLGLH